MWKWLCLVRLVVEVYVWLACYIDGGISISYIGLAVCKFFG